MKERLEELLQKNKWGSRHTNVQKSDNASMIQAYIDKSWTIHVTYDDSLDNLDDLLLGNSSSGFLDRFKIKRKKDISRYFEGKDNIDNLLYFLVAHEIGHWKYCPFDWDHYEDIISGVSKGLKDIGATEEQVESHSQRLFNYFADVVENVMNMYRDKNSQSYIDGFLAFYGKEGLRVGNFSEDFGVFVDINCRLGMNEKDEKDFATNFTKSDPRNYTEQVIRNLISDEDLARKTMNQELALDEKIKIYHTLANHENWYTKSYNFAKVIGKLMLEEEKQQEKKQKQKQENKQDKNQDQQNQPQQQNQSSEKQDQEKQEQQPQYQNQLPGEQNHREEIKENMRDLVKKSIKKGRDPLYADDTVLFDELYKGRAERLVMNLKEEVRSKLPIGYLQRVEVGPNSDFNNIDFQNPEFGVDENGNDDILLFEKRSPIFTESSGPSKDKSLPDILLVVDASGSMTGGFNPKKGVGEYDTLMRSVYSVFKALEDNNQVHALNYGLVLFDGMPNYFSGWHSFYDLDKVKEPMFKPSKHVSRGFTQLDQETLIQATDEAKRKFWAIYVSDGEVHNLAEAKPGIQYMADKGNHLTLVNIANSDSALSRVIEELKGESHNVSDSKDLPGLLLGKTQDIYG